MMKPIFLLCVLFVLLAACASVPTVEAPSGQLAPVATRNGLWSEAVSGVTPAVSTPTMDPYSGLYPSQTAIALYEVELDQSQAALDLERQRLELQILSDSATSTAEIAITSTARADAKATQVQAMAISGTQTAMPLTQVAISATQQVEDVNLKTKKVTAWLYPFLATVTVIAGIVFGGVKLGHAVDAHLAEKKMKAEAQALKEKTDALKPDAQGRFGLVPADALQSGKLINPNLQVRPVLDPDSGDEMTIEQAMANTGNQRELEKVRSLADSPAMSRAAMKLLREEARNAGQAAGIKITKPEAPVTEPSALTANLLPALPAPHFKDLFKWDGTLLPYGKDEQGDLMRVDPSVRAHFIVVGRSRSGKTLSSIRPMAACLLAMGWNVLVMGKRVDFMPFEDHPNFRLIAVDVRKDARKYVDAFQMLNRQMDVRDQFLADKRVSTWGAYGGKETMVIIDDYSGAMLRMPKKEAGEVLTEAKALAFDGAKFGLHLTLGIQRATWENIDTNLRSQMGRIVYSVESADDSRTALGEAGAERLPPQWNFLSKLSDDGVVHHGVGFALMDNEIEAFLKSRPVAQNDPTEWIDVKAEDTAVTAETITAEREAAYALAEKDIKIRDTYYAFLAREQKFSLREIEREVFGKTGGSYHNDVKRVIAQAEGCTEDEVAGVIDEKNAIFGATATATGQKAPDLRPQTA